MTQQQIHSALASIENDFVITPAVHVVPAPPTGPFDYVAAPRANPDRRLDGAWRVIDATGRKVAYFTCDGRDKCEAWILSHGGAL